MSGAAIKNRQTEATECGLAALAMVASMAGSNIDLAWLRQRYGTSMRGASAHDIIEVAASIGMSARALTCELEELRHLRTPAILHWNLNHFVVLVSIKGAAIRIFDPAMGFRTLRSVEVSRRFSGVAIELAPTPSFKRRVERSPLRLFSLISWSSDVRRGLIQVLLLSLLLQVYVLASPFYMQIAIDEAALKADAPLLTGLAVGFAAFALFNAIAEAIRAIALQGVSSLITWDMSQRLYHHLIRLPLPWFQRRRLADVQSRFQAVEPVRDLIASGLIAVVIDGCLATFTLALMVVYAPVLALVTIASFGIYAAMRLYSLPLNMRLGSEALLASVAEQGKRLETFRAIQTIKLMGGESRREAAWANSLAKMVETDQKSLLGASLFGVIQRLIEALSGVLIVYIGVKYIISQEMSIGMLYAFIAYRSQFMARCTSSLESVINWRLLDIHSSRLADIALTPVEPGLESATPGLPAIKGEIQFKKASFRYSPTDPFVLKGVSGVIGVGEMVAIVGGSGAGKSTLIKLMCGLFPATSGEVLLDGLPLSNWGPKIVRKAFGTVMQDDDLLPGSIADNIAFFDDNVDIDFVWECLRLAAIDEEVRAMPMRTDTHVGDMGSTLSGGQKQRILLARALYKRPSVLILDEATSHLDQKREKSINDALRSLNMTRVVVAHRAETIAAADRILLLGDGLREVQRRGSEAIQAQPATL